MKVNLEDLDLSVLLVNDPGEGVTASDEAIKREIVKQLIYKRADFISTGVKLVGMETFDNLDIKYTFPSDAAIQYPVPEGSGADLTKVLWAEFAFSLAKAEGRFFITDEAQIRGTDRVQWQTGIRRLGEAMAERKDRNILSTLYSGAGGTRACTAPWSTATAAQITGDVAAIVNTLLSAHGATDADLKNIAIVVPIAAWSGLLRILTVEGSNVQLLNWLQGSYNISIMPTKSSLNAFGAATRGLALITGPDTAVHGTLRAPADIPLVETKRQEGVGTEYIVRQFFATTMVPEESGVQTTNRCMTLTNVA